MQASVYGVKLASAVRGRADRDDRGVRMSLAGQTGTCKMEDLEFKRSSTSHGTYLSVRRLSGWRTCICINQFHQIQVMIASVNWPGHRRRRLCDVWGNTSGFYWDYYVYL